MTGQHQPFWLQLSALEYSAVTSLHPAEKLAPCR